MSFFDSFEPSFDNGLEKYEVNDEVSTEGICGEFIFSAEESDYSVVYFEDNDEDVFKMQGNLKTMETGQYYKIEGKVIRYRGEKQLRVKSFLIAKPKNKKGIIAYLQTLPGLKSKADVIYEAFGDDCLDIVTEKPEEVAKLKGIGLKTAERWSYELKKILSKRETTLKLLEYGLTHKQALKLIETYSTSIVKKINTNPYFLIDDVKGFGFLTCDKLALNIGVSPDDEFRVQAGIVYVLQQAAMEGNVYLPYADVVTAVKKLLTLRLSLDEMYEYLRNQTKTIHKYGQVFELDLDAMQIDYYNDEKYILYEPEISNEKIMLFNKNVIFNDNRFYLKKLYYSEINLATKLLDIDRTKRKIFTAEQIIPVLDIICRQSNIVLEEQQKKAVIQFNMYDSGVFILNGSAGTGKTFVLNMILKVREALGYVYGNLPKLKIMPVAPTGKATKVMQKSIHLDCKTIHRALCYIPEHGFTKSQFNLFEENFFVVDESSMLDVEIAEAFLSAIPNNSKIIFMGDTKQLASVGPGNVLKDIILSNRFTSVTLNVIKRQGLLSGIVKNANHIINREMIQSDPTTNDFFVMNVSDENKIKETVVESIRRLLKKNYEFDNIQVLIPQRTGALGVNAFNYLLQQTFNPIVGNETKALKTTFSIKGNPFELYFHKGDKVIHMKNDYGMKNYEKVAGRYLEIKESSGITNGECGIVEEIIQNGSMTTTVVRYENFYCQYEDVSDLELAYATTIHKSQGSQWPAVIVLAVNQHHYMLSNNILYTGITRARDFCCVIGSDSSISKAIETNKDDGRYTSLNEVLIGKE